MAFSDQGPRTICILSASGAVSCVTLRQASNSGGTVTCEVFKIMFICPSLVKSFSLCVSLVFEICIMLFLRGDLRSLLSQAHS